MRQLINKIIFLFRLEEFLFLFLFTPALISSLTLSEQRFPFFSLEWLSLIATTSILLLTIFIKKPFLKVVRDWLPPFFLYAIYVNLHHIIFIINPKDFDPIFLKIDKIFFGTHPTIFLEKIIFSPLTDFLTICYVFYFFYPLILGLIFYLRKEFSNFRKYISTVILCFYLGFVGFVLFPAVGPRYTLQDQYTKPLEGCEFTSNLRDVLDKLEKTKKDCFPSLHNAITLLVFLFFYRYQKKLTLFFLPLVLGIFLATIYLRYHYFADILAGWTLGLICFMSTADLNIRWKAKGF